MFGFFRPIHLHFVSLVALVVFHPKPLVETGRDLGRIMQGSQKKKEFREELIKRYQDKPGKSHFPEVIDSKRHLPKQRKDKRFKCSPDSNRPLTC